VPATEGGRWAGPTTGRRPRPRPRRHPRQPPHPPRRSGAVRRGSRRDLDALLEVEGLCFQPWRRASRKSLARSLRSHRQSVWIIDGVGRGRGGAVAAFVVVWHHASKLRIYDIATRPDLRGHGLGRRLVRHVEALARSAGCPAIVLEADPTEPGLVQWYERQGFRQVARLPEFYAPGRHAVRLVKET
jgi:ribosomal protein S18 acetylase RimI-like enzyme